MVAQRIGRVGEPLRDFSRRRQLAHRAPQPVRLREDVAHDKHQERADAVRAGQRKDAVAGVLVHHVKADDHHVPHPLQSDPVQYSVVVGIGDWMPCSW